MSDKMIRFIDSQYNDLFYLRDGENVRITREDGEILLCPCKFIDEYHTQVGNYLYHICEFAEKMERAGNTYAPERLPELPDSCYTTLPSTGEVIVIHKGEKGYDKCGFLDSDPISNRQLAANLNRPMKITRQQEAAMQGGCLYGWKTLAAKPSSYDLYGNMLSSIKNKARKVKKPER